MLVVEAKAGGLEKDVTAAAVHQLQAYLANLPRHASGLLVTDAKLAPHVRALLHENPQVRAVRWRSARDDHRLTAAIASLLRGIIEPKQQD
jgi:hypothetical protein